ncbi:hypothetical protein PaeCFBP13512_04060 [Paenibacillus sp. CFBP13512]|uniref:hypothetical protein n=1 Tax=Paenibacillus sp. CFBP13512 TaxID=2184007 RepID=UPI0010C0D21A|nr:hypothetical protein [Paenibacillus sp. CFBP13512]TKJ93567.1 hypothetical protein PaeCFBP13512_04060 [Paenibacillus sp. CFBP13512]
MQKLIDQALIGVSARINNEVNKSLGEYISKNNIKSTIALTNSIDRGFIALGNELLLLLNKLFKVGLKIEDIDKANEIINNYLEVEIKTIIKTCEEMTNFSIDNLNLNQFILKNKEELKVQLEFEFLYIKQEIKKHRKAVRWDLFKLTISAILGSTITIVVRHFLQ